MQDATVTGGAKMTTRSRSHTKGLVAQGYSRASDPIVAVVHLDLTRGITITFTRMPEEKKVKVVFCANGDAYPLESTTLDFIREAIGIKRTPFVFHGAEMLIPIQPDILELAWMP